MDEQEIRKEISNRLEIERLVRARLDEIEDQDQAPRKGRWAWLESKVSLLIIGALITGVLVPTFQFTQERINWHKQNRYDGLERQLGSMRASLKQFIAVQGLSAELYDLGLEILETRPAAARSSRLEEWRGTYRSIKARRVQENAAFAATVFYFPSGSRESIRTAWNRLLLPAARLETVVGELLSDSGEDGASAPASNDTVVELDVRLAEVNQAYERVLGLLRRQLEEVERESAEFQ